MAVHMIRYWHPHLHFIRDTPIYYFFGYSFPIIAFTVIDRETYACVSRFSRFKAAGLIATVEDIYLLSLFPTIAQLSDKSSTLVTSRFIIGSAAPICVEKSVGLLFCRRVIFCLR